MVTTTTPPVIHEPTGWLRSTGAAQVRRIRRLGLLNGAHGPFVLAPLVGRLTQAGTEADRTCDRCGRYCPPAEDYHVMTYHPVPRVALLAGLCAEHAAAEGVAR